MELADSECPAKQVAGQALDLFLFPTARRFRRQRGCGVFPLRLLHARDDARYVRGINLDQAAAVQQALLITVLRLRLEGLHRKSFGPSGLGTGSQSAVRSPVFQNWQFGVRCPSTAARQSAIA